GNKSRAKKRESLNVVPVGVADQQMNARGTMPHKQVFSQHSNACSGIKYESGAIVGADFDTRRVAPVDGGPMARRRNRAACSPKAYMHRATFLAWAPLTRPSRS